LKGSYLKGLIERETGCDLSIIVPCLNEEEHLPAFLRSLAFQARECDELIILDGGSRDNSRRLIDGFREKIHITGLIDETRNLGYVRNRGALAARGKLLLFTNADAVLPQGFLAQICQEFASLDVAALSGRTIPLRGGAICSAAYHAFDLIRWMAARMGRFCPSGNFLALRASVFQAIGGFRDLRVNEDGELGIRLSQYSRERGVKVKFIWSLAAAHYADRFRRGALQTLMFYAYVFGNFHPLLRRLLAPIERKSAREF